MKKAFDDETAQFLGYQKYYPTRMEWFAYWTIAIIVTLAIIFGGAFLINNFQ